MYKQYKKLSGGLFDPVRMPDAADPGTLGKYRRLMSKFEKCAQLREQYATRFVERSRCDAKHMAAIVAAKTRATECKHVLSQLRSLYQSNVAREEVPLVNTFDVLPDVAHGDETGDNTDGGVVEGNPKEDSNPAPKDNTQTASKSTVQQLQEDDDEVIEAAMRSAKLEVLCNLRADVYGACDRYCLSFTNEIKYEMVHSLLLFMYSEPDKEKAKARVRDFLHDKAFLLSLGFFCMNNLRRGNEGVMRRAARLVQARFGPEISTMSLKDVLIQIHCTLTLFYG